MASCPWAAETRAPPISATLWPSEAELRAAVPKWPAGRPVPDQGAGRPAALVEFDPHIASPALVPVLIDVRAPMIGAGPSHVGFRQSFCPRPSLLFAPTPHPNPPPQGTRKGGGGSSSAASAPAPSTGAGRGGGGLQ